MAIKEKQPIKLTQQQFIDILNITVECIALHDNLANIRGIIDFNKELVRQCKALVHSLQYINKEAGEKLFNVAYEEMENLVELKAKLLTEMNRLSPEQWQIAAYVFKWMNNPNSLKYAQVTALCIADDAEEKLKG